MATKRKTLRIKAYEKDGHWYAADSSGRLWGDGKNKTILRKNIGSFNKKNLNVPKLVLK
jgi:hypothetical protein